MRSLLLLLLLTTSLPEELSAQSRKWHISYGEDASVSNARLNSVESDLLTVETKNGLVTIPIDSLRWLEARVEKVNTGVYVPLGIVVGAGLGYIIGSSLEDKNETPLEAGGGAGPSVIVPVAGAGLGGITGGFIASAQGMRKFRLAGKNNTEKKQTLDSLLVAESAATKPAEALRNSFTDLPYTNEL